MKKLLSSILVSTMLLSTVGTSFAMETTQNKEHLQEIHSETLSTSPSSDFVFSNGVITEYIGSGGSVVIPSTINGQTVTKIDNHAFSFCDKLTSVVIPDTVTSLGYYVFYGCSELTTAVVGNSVPVLDECVFSFCHNLTSITLGNSVREIGENAFGTSGIVSITIPASVVTIDSIAFNGCPSHTSIVVSDANQNYSAQDGVLFNKDKTKLIHYPDAKSPSAYDIPSSVTRIEDYAFSNNLFLSTVSIPNSVTNIGKWAFGACQSLNTIYYEGSESDKQKMDISSDYMGYQSEFTWIYNSPMLFTTPEVAYPTWATTYIDFVSTKIMPDITPENCVTSSSRGLIAQSLYNMSGNNANVSATKNFNDVGTYAKAIAWCDVNNIMNGESDDYFGTNNNVTREQFALILQKVALATGRNAQNSSSSVLNSYSDVGNISSWAKDGMAWAVSKGLMSGSENKLNPQGNITRTEVAVMLYNFNKL